MFVLAKTHAAIVAQRDAEIDRIGVLLEHSRLAHDLSSDLLREAERRNGELRRQLAVFTAPRARDAKGHFISAKGASAC